MTARLKGKRAAALLAALLLMSMLVVAGCSEKTETTTSETTVVTGSTETTATGAEGTGTAGASTGTSLSSVVGGSTKEEYDKSLPQLQEQAKASPTDLAVLQRLAIAQYQTGRFDEAAATYLAMIKVKDEPLTHNNYANVLRDAGKLSEAEKEYRAAIAAQPTLVVAYVNLSSMLVQGKKQADALAILDEGIAKTSGEDKERLQKIREQFAATPTTT